MVLLQKEILNEHYIYIYISKKSKLYVTTVNDKIFLS